MDTATQKLIDLATRIEPLPKALPLSYSKVKSLLSCPLKYCKTYVDKGKKGTPFDPSPAVVGKFVHGVLEACVVRTTVFGMTEEGADFDKTWGDMYNSCPLTKEEKEMLQPLRSPTERILKRVMAVATKHQLQLKSEQSFNITRKGLSVPAADWNNRLLYGYQDLLAINAQQTQALILDYKTHAPSEDNQEAADLQTQLYTLANFLRYPRLQKIQAGGAYIPTEDILLTTFKREDARALVDSVTGMLEEFIATHPKEGEVFEPTTGKHCEWCNFSEGCAVGQQFLSKKKRRSRTK